jgi:hypothetical protein
MLQVILNILLELVNKLTIPLVAYFAGKSKVKADVTEEELKHEQTKNEIAESNLTKSDADILAELLRDDTRSQP